MQKGAGMVVTFVIFISQKLFGYEKKERKKNYQIRQKKKEEKKLPHTH
jgi:hypothetical protein